MLFHHVVEFPGPVRLGSIIFAKICKILIINLKLKLSIQFLSEMLNFFRKLPGKLRFSEITRKTIIRILQIIIFDYDILKSLVKKKYEKIKD